MTGHVLIDLRCDFCGLTVGRVRLDATVGDDGSVMLGSGGLAAGTVADDRRKDHICPPGLKGV